MRRSSNSRRAATRRDDDARRAIRGASHALVWRRDPLARPSVRRGRSSARRSTARSARVAFAFDRSTTVAGSARSILGKLARSNPRDAMDRFDEPFVWRSVSKSVPHMSIQSEIENVYPRLQPPPSLSARARQGERRARSGSSGGAFSPARTRDDGLRTSRFAHLSPHARPTASTRPRTPHPPRARPHQALDQKNSHDGLHRGRGRALRPGRRVPGSLHPHAALPRGHLSPGDHQHRCVPASARRPPRRARESRARGLGLNATGRSEPGVRGSKPSARAPPSPSPPPFSTDPPPRFRPALPQVRSVTSRTVSRRS